MDTVKQRQRGCGPTPLGGHRGAVKWVRTLRARGANLEAATVLLRVFCLQASDCGRVCERLVKAPGKIVWCVDIKSGAKVELYAALERAEFHCPEGRF